MKKDNKVNPADIVKGFSAALTKAGYVHGEKGDNVPTNVNDIIEQLPSDRRERIEHRAAQLIEEEKKNPGIQPRINIDGHDYMLVSSHCVELNDQEKKLTMATEALKQIGKVVPHFEYVLLDKNGRDIWLHDLIAQTLLDMKRKEGDATCDSTKKSETQTQTSTGVAGSVAPKGSTPAAATTASAPPRIEEDCTCDIGTVCRIHGGPTAIKEDK